MYVLLFSNNDLEDHLNYIHRRTLNFRTNVKYLKTIKRQTGFINITPLKKALGGKVEKISLHDNSFYKSLVFSKNRYLVSNEYLNLMRSLSYNLVILNDSAQLMRLLLDEKLFSSKNKSIFNQNYMIRIFQTNDIHEIFTLSTKFTEEYEFLYNAFNPDVQISNKMLELIKLSKKHNITQKDLNIINQLHEKYNKTKNDKKSEISNLNQIYHNAILQNIKNWSIPIGLDNDFKNKIKNNYLDTIFNLTNE